MEQPSILGGDDSVRNKGTLELERGEEITICHGERCVTIGVKEHEPSIRHQQ